ncbi:MAG: hypothetical protein KatS3mg003_0074 [Candidatus Nitrosocaldaceae archaeon]|nr:MAG: hypothetical protein KatS3mg003_0074 [Candidatus Nitrosocaldaceae archaeon]
MHTIQNYSIYKLLVAVFMLYVIGDYVTTFVAIEVSPLGIHGEANPIAVMLYNNYGSISLLIVKLVMFSILAVVSLLLGKNIKIKHIIKKILIIFTLFSAIIVSINIYSILTI